MNNRAKILFLGLIGTGMVAGSMYGLGKIRGREEELKDNAWLIRELNNINDKQKKEIARLKEKES